MYSMCQYSRYQVPLMSVCAVITMPTGANYWAPFLMVHFVRTHVYQGTIRNRTLYRGATGSWLILVYSYTMVHAIHTGCIICMNVLQAKYYSTLCTISLGYVLKLISIQILTYIHICLFIPNLLLLSCICMSQADRCYGHSLYHANLFPEHSAGKYVDNLRLDMMG